MIKGFKLFVEGLFDSITPKVRTIYEIDVRNSNMFPKSADTACPYYDMMMDYILERLNEQIRTQKLSENQYEMIKDEVARLVGRIWRNYTYLYKNQLKREYHFFLTDKSLGLSRY
jgi:hypothetical protein